MRKIGKSIQRFWKSRYGHFRFRLMDIVWLTYLGLVGFLLFFFHKAVNRWLLYILLHALLTIVILEIVRTAEKHPQKKILWFVRTMYPIPLFLYSWEELAALMPMLYGNFWMTDLVVRWDKLIFGVYPTVWVQRLYTPWLNEIMHFMYVGYYSFFILVPFFLYFWGKKKETLAVFSILSFTYLTNFFLFFLIPTLDPNHVPLLQELHIKEQTGYLFVPLNKFIQDTGGIPVAAFPSSHVAGALVWALAALRYVRKLGCVLLPIAVGVGLSVVYIQLHHALDPIFGYIWGALCYLVALKLIQKRGEDPLVPMKKPLNS
jgi:membrane-associated phospholipid phosphatase